MHSEAMLLKFVFLIPSLATSSALGDCPANQYVPGIGCAASPNICEVNCPKEGDCALSSACADANVTETITHDNLDQEKCQELCGFSNEEEEANRCRFWRYEVINNDKEVCSLMSSTQCTVPEVCTATSCYTGDVGCSGGEMPEPDNSLECPAKMVFHTEPGYIHWGCVNEVADISSPYDPDVEKMPANTLCTTAHRCLDWNAGSLTDGMTLWRKLRVFCDGADGQWKQDPAADGEESAYIGDTGVLGVDGNQAILEHLCIGGDEAPTLVVDLASAGNGVGADLVCDVDGMIDGTTFTITAPNHCLLLCDLHIGMTIDGQLAENGEYAFVDQDGKVITAADVICWQGKKI